MRDKLFAVVLAGTAAGAIMLTPAAGYTAGAAENAAAHDIAEKFAREAAKGDAQARQRAENDRRQADAVRRKAADEQRKIEEAEMLARARAEAEQRRMEIERARAEAERADRERRAEEERRLAEAEARRKAEEAKAAEAARLAEAARKAEEERRLAEIRAEEEARAAAAVRKAEEEHRQAEEARRTAEAEQARIAEEARQAEAARKAAEDRRLAEIRAEEEARAAEAIRKAAEEHRLAEEARRQAEASRRAEDDRRTAERARLEAEREAEAERLAERLRSVREARDAQALAGGGVERLEPGLAGSAGHRTTSGEGSWDPPPERARHVSVLLLMQPGDRGIRRNNKTADPVLCGYHACYVSNGPDRAASLLPVRKALGFFRTWGRRAGACNNSLGCVFRDVDVDALGGVMRPVDMRVVRHDRREAQDIQFASQCEIHRGRLMCADGIYAEDYAMWLVPERTAAAAGPAALMQALDEGLPDAERTAGAAPWSVR